MTLNDNTKITFGILTGEVIKSVVFTINLWKIYYCIIPDLRHLNDKKVQKKFIRFTTRM
jgi:prolyl-tRNA editing enzyme YbaK/EbsC (Cys-tRNA(Pro) deacylase)